MQITETIKKDHILLDVEIEPGDLVGKGELGRNFPCEVYANIRPHTGEVLATKEQRAGLIKNSTREIFQSLQAERSA